MTLIADISPTRTTTGAPAVLLQTERDNVEVTRPVLEAVLAVAGDLARMPMVTALLDALAAAEAEARSEGWLP